MDVKEVEARPSLITTLGMEMLDAPRGEARARMFVDEKVCHPFNRLSGGASLALAETVAGHASLEMCEKGFFPWGVEVSGHHFLSVKPGQWLFAEGKILHEGKTLHVWNIDLLDEQRRLISTVRVTNFLKQETFCE